MESIEELLLKNGFPKPHHIEQRASIASLFTKEKRCGIYVLHFANGEYYVGQSIDVVRRHSDHRRKHTDIRQISFKPVPPSGLDAEEKRLVALLEHRCELRNISLTAYQIY